MLGTSTIVLQVAPSLPVKNVAQLVEYLKKNPGTTYGTAGVGTSMHLAGVLFAQRTGTDIAHVAYKGSAPGINDMLGGHLALMFDNLPASLPHIQTGKLRALAVAGKSRSPSLPDVPTISEAGVNDYSIEPWFAVYGPEGMPASVVQALNKAYVEALATPEVKEKLLQAGFSPRSSAPQELASLSATEYERLGKVARAANMTTD